MMDALTSDLFLQNVLSSCSSPTLLLQRSTTYSFLSTWKSFNHMLRKIYTNWGYISLYKYMSWCWCLVCTVKMLSSNFIKTYVWMYFFYHDFWYRDHMKDQMTLLRKLNLYQLSMSFSWQVSTVWYTVHSLNPAQTTGVSCQLNTCNSYMLHHPCLSLVTSTSPFQVFACFFLHNKIKWIHSVQCSIVLCLVGWTCQRSQKRNSFSSCVDFKPPVVWAHLIFVSPWFLVLGTDPVLQLSNASMGFLDKALRLLSLSRRLPSSSGEFRQKCISASWSQYWRPAQHPILVIWRLHSGWCQRNRLPFSFGGKTGSGAWLPQTWQL